MPTLEDFASLDEIKAEYKKTFLLNLFQKLCVRLEKDLDRKKSYQNIYRQSYDKANTTKVIIKREFDYKLLDDEAAMMTDWIWANLTKSLTRKSLSLDLKRELYAKQKGRCMACGEELGTDWKKIHIDHIIPFKLVGDELKDNYQDLCETCNECKSARTDYIFKSMLKLN